MFKLDALGEKNLLTVKPDLQRVARRAIEISAAPFTIVQGARTQSYQDYLYAQGRTRPGKVVTWTRNSKHIGGNALDFAALSNGKIDWNEHKYPAIKDAFVQASHELGIGIESGQEWKTKDWGHIQLNPSRNKMPTAPKPALQPLKPPPVAQIAPPPSVAVAGSTRVKEAMALLVALGWEKHQAAAIVGNGIWESGGNAKMDLITTALGDKGSAHGAWQWRGDRYIGKNGLLSFAMRQYPGHSSTETQVQAAFVDWEMRNVEKRVYNSLKAAKTVDEAVESFIGYLRPVHFTWENPRAGHGFDKRLALAKALL